MAFSVLFLSQGCGSFRIASETTTVAMPETAIGK